MARNFNGTSDRIEIVDHAALTFGAVDYTFTLSLWMRRCDLSGGAPRFLLNNGYSWVAGSTAVLVWGDDNPTFASRITFRFDADNGSYVEVVSNDVTTVDTWHHLAAVYDGSTLRTYLDGVVQTATSTVSITTVNSANPTQLGRGHDGSGFFAGSLAEIAKWDCALLADKIAELATGVRAVDIGARPNWYLPLDGGWQEGIAGLELTNFGTSATEHPACILTAGSIL